MEQRIRTIALICILLSGITATKAQSAGDIDTLSQWRVSVEVIDGFEIITYEFKYYISGTIAAGSHEYYKVYRSGYSYVNPSEPEHFTHIYSGAIREHENKWYAHDYTNEDVLLYDFNMSIGDTVESMTTLGAILTIIDLDTIMIDGEPKRRLFLDYGGWGSGDQYIIEDVGASTGLFEALIFFEIESSLHCYAIDFDPLWMNPDFGWCDLTVKVEENEESNMVAIYPNPFTTSTAIEFTLNGKSKIQISIYNTFGQSVYQFEDHFERGTHKVTWSPRHLPSGMYYGVLRTDEGVSVVKILKE